MGMSEYIEREKALDFISEVEPIICMPPDNKPTFTAVKDPDMVAYLESIPAADVRPVVRGKWKRVVDFTGVEAFGYKETMIVGYGCNVCGYEVDVSEGDYNFCPNCGADMREES